MMRLFALKQGARAWALALLGAAAAGPALAGGAPAGAAVFDFVENRGQWAAPVRYAAEVPGGWLFLENNAFTYNLLGPEARRGDAAERGAPVRGHAFRVRLLGAAPAPAAAGEQRREAYHNYFLGRDPKRWAGHVPLFGAVRYAAVYPGVNLRWHHARGPLEYDFELAPGARPEAIRLSYEGLDGLRLLPDGRLELQTSVGAVREAAPVAWQPGPGGRRQPVRCRFVLRGRQVGFALGAYDRRRPLTVDPALVFGTYSGTATGLSANTSTQDAAGNVYTAGYTLGPQYPVTTGAYKTQYVNGNMGIQKFAPGGNALRYATYLGAAANGNADYPLALSVSAAEELLVLGTTNSPDYPTTAGAYDRSYGGAQDYVLTRFNAAGSALLASTYLGGSGQEGSSLSTLPAALAVAPDGDVLVGGATLSNDYPTTAGAVQPTRPGGTGRDGVVTRLSPGLTQLRWSTYYGAAGSEDGVYALAFGPGGAELYAGGSTRSNALPGIGGRLGAFVPNGPPDGFAVRLNAGTGAALNGQYFDTPGTDLVRFLAWDAAGGQLLVAGATDGNYPYSPGTVGPVGAIAGATCVFVHGWRPDFSAATFAARVPVGQGASWLFQSNVLTGFGVDGCGRLYLSAYAGPGAFTGTVNGAPVAPTTAGAYSTQPRTLYLATLGANAQSLLYGTSFGAPGIGNTHLHFAADNHVSADGVLVHVECATSTQFPTTPGAFAPTWGGGGNNGATFKFDLSPGPAGVRAGLAPVPPGCAPYSAALAATGAGLPGATYTWDFGDGSPPSTQPASLRYTYAQPGVYRVRLVVQAPAGLPVTCGLLRDTASTLVRVQAPQPLRAGFSFVPPACTPYVVSFASQGGGPGVTYRWDFGDGSPPSSLPNPQHTYAQPGTFNVALTLTRPSACGDQTSTVSQAVRVDLPSAPLTGQLLLPPAACAGTAVALGSTSNGAARFRWDFGDGSPVDTTASPRHVYARPGRYAVSVRLQRGTNCGPVFLTLNGTLQVLDPAVPERRLDSLDCRGVLTLDPRLPAGALPTWGTGETTPTLDVTAPGTYRVVGTVPGQACPVAVEFEVRGPDPRQVPNVVTPNGDGRNDLFVVPPAFRRPSLRVFNRWGRLVYENPAYDDSWNAAGLPAGTYFYELLKPDCALRHKGWVEVVR